MKTVDEIYEEMLVCLEEKTGLEPQEGCDLAVRLYAVAAQVSALYIQAQWIARQAFPQTAESDYLDLHAQVRGLERKEAVAAQGILRFTGEAVDWERTIPKGTVCVTTGLVRFETTADAVLSPGATSVDVPAQALLPGREGNVAAHTVTAMAVAPLGVQRCDNPAPFTGGQDQESDADLRQRVLDTFRRLPNGANAAFYEQGALSFDQVAAASVIPRPRGLGTLDVVVATYSGIPGGELLKELEEYFQARREISVEVQVKAPKTVTVDISVKVAHQAGQEADTVQARVREAIQRWFTGERLGKDVLLAQLGNLIYSCEGVENYTILAPVADKPMQPGQLPVLGSLTVEGMA